MRMRFDPKLDSPSVLSSPTWGFEAASDFSLCESLHLCIAAFDLGLDPARPFANVLQLLQFCRMPRLTTFADRLPLEKYLLVAFRSPRLLRRLLRVRLAFGPAEGKWFPMAPVVPDRCHRHKVRPTYWRGSSLRHPTFRRTWPGRPCHRFY